MNMAADSNMGFHQGVFPSSFYNQHVVSFQTGTAGAMPGVGSDSVGIGGTGGVVLAGNPGMIAGTSPMIAAGSSSSNIMLEQVPGLKHDMGLSVDWTSEEVAILKAGLIKYANEPSIMKYIKVAALLRDKTVRDVALRCRWMSKENGKRRKTEDYCAGKKIKDRKEKMVDSSSNTVIQPVPTDNMAAYSFMMHHASHNNRFSSGVPIIDGVTWQLLEENAQVFSQITANFATFKVEDDNVLVITGEPHFSLSLSCLCGSHQIPPPSTVFRPAPTAMLEPPRILCLPFYLCLLATHLSLSLSINKLGLNFFLFLLF